jgi:hypothetical protein
MLFMAELYCPILLLIVEIAAASKIDFNLISKTSTPWPAVPFPEFVQLRTRGARGAPTVRSMSSVGRVGSGAAVLHMERSRIVGKDFLAYEVATRAKRLSSSFPSLTYAPCAVFSRPLNRVPRANLIVFK